MQSKKRATPHCLRIMATHAVRKAAHALAEEGELLNVYAELKDLANAFEYRVRQQERVCLTNNYSIINECITCFEWMEL